MQPVTPLAQSRNLFQQVLHIVWQPCQAARSSAVFRERVVRPEEAQYFGKVGLAASEKPADPGSWLFGLSLITDVGIENANETALILPFADEVLKFEA